jgi:hypothetical protein
MQALQEAKLPFLKICSLLSTHYKQKRKGRSFSFPFKYPAKTRGLFVLEANRNFAKLYMKATVKEKAYTLTYRQLKTISRLLTIVVFAC